MLRLLRLMPAAVVAGFARAGDGALRPGAAQVGRAALPRRAAGDGVVGLGRRVLTRCEPRRDRAIPPGAAGAADLLGHGCAVCCRGRATRAGSTVSSSRWRWRCVRAAGIANKSLERCAPAVHSPVRNSHSSAGKVLYDRFALAESAPRACWKLPGRAQIRVGLEPRTTEPSVRGSLVVPGLYRRASTAVSSRGCPRQTEDAPPKGGRLATNYTTKV